MSLSPAHAAAAASAPTDLARAAASAASGASPALSNATAAKTSSAGAESLATSAAQQSKNARRAAARAVADKELTPPSAAAAAAEARPVTPAASSVLAASPAASLLIDNSDRDERERLVVQLQARDKQIADLEARMDKTLRFAQNLVKFLTQDGLIKPEQAAANQEPATDSFQADLLAYSVKQTSSFKQSMERLDVILAELVKLKTDSDQLKACVLDMKLTETLGGTDGEKTIRYCLKEFQIKLAAYELRLAETSHKILFFVDSKKVHSHLKRLNQLTVCAPNDRVQLRDDFTSKWNKICLQSHLLEWELAYMKASISLLPHLKDIHAHLAQEVGVVQNKKYEYQQKKGIQEAEWDALKRNLELYKTGFAAFDKSMVEFNRQLLALLDDLKEKELPEEYLKAFEAHNDTMKSQNRADLINVLSEWNKQNRNLAILLVNQWNLACQQLDELGLQIDQIGYACENKSVPYKSSVGASAWLGGKERGKFAKPSVKFDPALMPK